MARPRLHSTESGNSSKRIAKKTASKSASTSISKYAQQWANDEDESASVAAFIAIIRFVRSHDDQFSTAIKKLYICYVQACNVCTAETWPKIRFMQESFAELCFLRPLDMYEHAFAYIRQTAIHLRNAMISKKKELVQTVYNWQYVQCLYLWSRVLTGVQLQSSTANNSKRSDNEGHSHYLNDLLYPLCQVIIGCARLMPGAKFMPIKFHCIRLLIMISKQMDLFTPIFQLLCEVLRDCKKIATTHSNRRAKVSMANRVNLHCMIKASKSQLADITFFDAALHCCYELILEASANYGCSIAFPALIRPLVLQLRIFAKSCHHSGYARKMKGLAAKLREQATYVDNHVNTNPIDLADIHSAGVLEFKMANDANPIKTLHESWLRMSKTDGLQETGGLSNEWNTMSSAFKGDKDIESQSDQFNGDEPVEHSGKTLKKTRARPLRKKVKIEVVELGKDLDSNDLVQDLVMSD